MWVDGWPFCDNCGCGIGYEGVFRLPTGDEVCVFCYDGRDGKETLDSLDPRE